MIWTLMWKDLKLSRTPLAFATVLMLTPPGLCAALYLCGRMRSQDEFLMQLLLCLFYGAALSTLAVPAYAAMAFARERRDRSAEFLYMLPVARWRVVVSKFVVAMALVLLPWAIVAPIVLMTNPWGGWAVMNGSIRFQPLDWSEVAQVAAWLGAGDLCLFGVAWLLSSVLRSETIAAAISFVLTLIVVAGTLTWIDSTHASSMLREELSRRVLMSLLLTLGGGGLIVGMVIALTRRTV